MINELAALVGEANVMQGEDMARWSSDWTGAYRFSPLAVVRPGSTAEVAAVVKWANETGTTIVPVSGNTGLAGGTRADGAVMLSLDRMNQIRDLRPEARVAIVEAGVILSNLHDAADAVEGIPAVSRPGIIPKEMDHLKESREFPAIHRPVLRFLPGLAH
ncbi:MAG: FAD-binding oxidoreductase, partial [Pseudomonadota bacterium]|nr:FAD-binding oxidoreductase [Pseudomonadota bacterium]